MLKTKQKTTLHLVNGKVAPSDWSEREWMENKVEGARGCLQLLQQTEMYSLFHSISEHLLAPPCISSIDW